MKHSSISDVYITVNINELAVHWPYFTTKIILALDVRTRLLLALLTATICASKKWSQQRIIMLTILSIATSYIRHAFQGLYNWFGLTSNLYI